MTDTRTPLTNKDDVAEATLSYQRYDLPRLPEKVNLCDLQANDKLLTDEQLTDVKQILQELPDGRYSKKIVKQKFGVIKTHNHYYAVYKGMRHGKHLGEGAFGKVKLVQHQTTKAWFKLKTQHRRFDLLGWEQKFLSILDVDTVKIFARERKQHLLSLYISGDDLQNLDTNRLSPLRILDIIIQAFLIIKKINLLNFLHCDIKLENFIYDYENNKLEIIDFGYAKEKDKNGYGILYRNRSSIEGTDVYIAPEIINESRYNDKTEIYALGVMANFLMGFRVKLEACYLWEKNIIGIDCDSIFKKNTKTISFLNKLTHKMPKERPDFDEAVAFFSVLRAELLPLQPTTVAFVDIYDFLQSSLVTQANYFTALRSVHEVCLFSTNSVDRVSIHTVNKILKSEHINLRKQYYIVAEKDLAKLPEIVSQLSVDEKIIYDYFFISSTISRFPEKQQVLKENGVYTIEINTNQTVRPYQGDVNLSKNIVKADVMEKVEKALDNEKVRLRVKFSLFSDTKDIKISDDKQIAQEKYSLLAESANQLRLLYQQNKLTYGILFRQIERMQKDIMNTRQSCLQASSLFKPSATEKACLNLKAELIPHLKM